MYYRKYRPQKIEDLDSQKIRESLGQSLLSGKFSSAYLLTGPRGIGKTTTARLIAKAILCEKRKLGEEPCNACEMCQSVTAGNNLDVIEIDAASNTSVEDIRDLREKVKFAPSRGKSKIYIIDEVHMLSTSAFNALLKTLEEPPSHVTFVLATTDVQKVPETILSRCLRFDFSSGTIEEIIRSLQRVIKGEKLDVKNEDLEKIAKMARGSFRDGHKLLEQFVNNKQIFIDEVTDVSEFLKLLQEKNGIRCLDWLNNYVDNNQPIDRLIENCVEILRADILNLSAEKIDLLKKLNKAYGELRDAVLPQLPLELAIVEWLNFKNEVLLEKIEVVESTETFDLEIWKKILEETKPYNHSLTAVLRSAKPIGVANDILTIAVKYKFHMEKLVENKNREVVEKIVSGIMRKNLKINYKLEGV